MTIKKNSCINLIKYVFTFIISLFLYFSFKKVIANTQYCKQGNKIKFSFFAAF